MLSRNSLRIFRLMDVYSDLPKRLIHRDVHLGNFLFEGSNFTGYIDFDLSQKNIRIFDICYFLLGLLCRESGSQIEDTQWFEHVKSVVNGYHQIIPLADVEKASIVTVMKNIELLFVAYFLSEKDEVLARDAGKIFKFICDHEAMISKMVMNE